MATSFMKKTMVYLGLLDDEYDEYDDLRQRHPGGSPAPSRMDTRARRRPTSRRTLGGSTPVGPGPQPAARASTAGQHRPGAASEPDAPVPVARRSALGVGRPRLLGRCTWSPRPVSVTPRRSPTA